jgi:hypothetical protein
LRQSARKPDKRNPESVFDSGQRRKGANSKQFGEQFAGADRRQGVVVGSR